MKTNPSLLAAMVIAGAALSSGCLVEHDYPSGAVVAEAPPAPQIDVVGVAPGPDYVWIGGSWAWHNRWDWERGHYVRRPHPSAVWVEPRWERGRRGWVRHEGHWR